MTASGATFSSSILEVAGERLAVLRESFGREQNPFILHIVRRTRALLETKLNPEANLL